MAAPFEAYHPIPLKRCNFLLEEKQLAWLREVGKRNGVSASAALRAVLDLVRNEVSRDKAPSIATAGADRLSDKLD